MSRWRHTPVERLGLPAALTVVAALAATLCLGAGVAAAGRGTLVYTCPGSGKAPEQMNMHELRTSVLCLVNRLREHYHLAPLHFNRDLRISASHHSKDMVAHGYFAHDGSRGSTMEQRVLHSGYLARTNGFYIGENIGGGMGRRFGSPIAVVRSWMHSFPHRENLLSTRFHDFGVGVARGFPGGGGAHAATYTLDFGSRHQ